jgi:YVTN family beta-propeller protein
MGAKECERDRMMAFGPLPPGRYDAIIVGVARATLRGEQGPASMVVPTPGVRVDIAFTVARRRGVVLELSLRYADSVRSGFSFTPSFAAGSPGTPALGVTALVSCRGSNVVIAFDRLTGRVVGAIPTGKRPAGLVLDRIRRRAYVAVAGDDAVEVIDLLQNAVIDRLALSVGDEPLDLALTPDGRTLFTANAGSNTVSVIDTTGLAEIDRIQVGHGPEAILMDDSARRAFSFDTLSDSISILDLNSRAVIGTIGTEAAPTRGDLDRRGQKLYVIHRSSPYLAVVDLASLAVERRIYVGTGAVAVGVDPRSDRIYLAKRNAASVEVFDPASFLPIDFIPLEGECALLAFDLEQNNLGIVERTARRVRIVRLVGSRVVAEVDVADDPFGLAFVGER